MTHTHTQQSSAFDHQMTSATHIALDRPGGAVAVEIAGTGPLVICVPGMGDLRGSYRFLAPALVEAGYRVAVMDLRGHGDSDASFSEYGDLPTAGDIVAMLDHLGSPAVLVGSSMGAACAVLAAAERPDVVRGLVLIGPFVRDGQTSWARRATLRVAMMFDGDTVRWRRIGYDVGAAGRRIEQASLPPSLAARLLVGR